MRRRRDSGFPWVKVALCALLPLVLLNLAVAFFGDTVVSPFSLSFLEQKAHALATYARHRPSCLLEGHPELAPLIRDSERRHRIPTGLLEALVEVESNTQPHRISPAGAMGPGQLMPGTASLLRVADPFDPAPALDGSARYLAEQLERFRGNVRLAVAAYNAGPGNVNGRVPRNGETEFYVEKVLNHYERLRPRPPPPRPSKPAPAAKRQARPVSAPPRHPPVDRPSAG
ncbi:lytic transglycosylase domain-containing protein [Archangium lansingense]|uniref:Lytic transglycosylase domain-containing protein n=1 Tax=Archangium lansingense TaxID=2995310 RepID=A0ABT4AJG8_9BACT|nr:lytic transglycosylase domain-containing protein [Archangium lansinium]MCY1081840.1 lytic transglycosylase domain-containing protein [Archangium lansinium]